MKTKSLAFGDVEVKFDANVKGRFTGYASKFNGVDAYGDTIMPGAYKDTIENRQRPVALRWNHYGPIIGKWWSMKEDEVGLLVEGELTLGHSVADDAYALLKHEAIDGLSIGYRVDEDSVHEKEDGTRLLTKIDLVEISVVESPADLGARIGEIKSYLEDFSSLKEVERFLRDAVKLSKADATALVSRVKSIAQSESDAERNEAKAKELINQISNINQMLRS